MFYIHIRKEEQLDGDKNIHIHINDKSFYKIFSSMVLGLPGTLPSPNSKNPKKFLTFPETELSSSNIKTNSDIFSGKAFLIFS